MVAGDGTAQRDGLTRAMDRKKGARLGNTVSPQLTPHHGYVLARCANRRASGESPRALARAHFRPAMVLRLAPSAGRG